jgi:hypothetical protein
MTVTQLIANVLDKIRRDFYRDRAREYKRDERALMKTIARYGYECNQRGWYFEAQFIYQDLLKLLLAIRTAEADIQYLPVYLEGAIDRHLRQRAEEFSAQAKAIDGRCHRILNTLAPSGGEGRDEGARQLTPVEILGEMFKGIKTIQKSRRHARQAAPEKQKELL